MRVLLDTNVLIAAFATRGLCQDVLQVVLAQHRLVVGRANLDELERVLGDKLGMAILQIQEAVEFIREHAEVVSPVCPAPWPESDPDDRWVVAATLDGSADLLVTGDKGLIDAASREVLQTVTPRGFWELLHGDD